MATEPHQSFLAPGQRYARSGHPAWCAENQLTILAVSRDLSGLVWATYCNPYGEDYTTLATQLETAVIAGEIVPVSDGQVVPC